MKVNRRKKLHRRCQRLPCVAGRKELDALRLSHAAMTHQLQELKAGELSTKKLLKELQRMRELEGELTLLRAKYWDYSNLPDVPED